MIDPKKVDINQLPKKLCDGAIGGFNEEIFSFSLTSGNNLDSFAATPKVMKSVAVWMNSQVGEYEKQFGEIDLVPPQIQSPFQAGDLGKS